MSKVSSLEKDLRAIDAVDTCDVQFALANDADRMMSQWTDDIVLLQPGAPIMRGRVAIAEAFRSTPRPEIVEYALDIHEVEVVGDYAFQWGTYRYGMRPPGGGETTRTHGKILRVLQPDGWNVEDSPGNDDGLTE
jgi:ketosteroid isomerase-like protein